VSEFYSAAGPLSRRLADDSLAHWFAHLADQARIMAASSMQITQNYR
jgi:hypothetical protein